MSERHRKFTEVVGRAVARRGVALMGICNVTPDSFSDGGRYHGHVDAKCHVDALLRDGADILDIGGESTRPGAPSVSPALQLERVLPVVAYAAARACVSVDTTSPVVAAACLDAGAHAVNDVSLLADSELASVCAANGAALVLSHARGPQSTMAGFGKWPSTAYGDVVREVLAEWELAAQRAAACGLAREALVMDPGLGFSKSARHSMELLRRVGELAAALDVPVLVGASRKSFLTLVDHEAAPAEREGASTMAALHAARHGVRVLRVHDVRAVRQALDLEIVLSTPRRKA